MLKWLLKLYVSGFVMMNACSRKPIANVSLLTKNIRIIFSSDAMAFNQEGGLCLNHDGRRIMRTVVGNVSLLSDMHCLFTV